MILFIINFLLIISESFANSSEDISRAKVIGDEIKETLDNANKVIESENATKTELIKQRDLIIAQLSAKTKEFRRIHDIIIPELKHYPIIIVKKSKMDSKRAVISAATEKGAEDFAYKLHSPCERLYSTIESEKTSLEKLKDKFATEQETLDMMPIEQRINYDDHMIKHWTEVVRELEADISAIC